MPAGNGCDDVATQNVPIPLELSAFDELGEDNGEAFLRLVQRADGGDEEAARALRPILRASPRLTGQLGDLARVAERAWIERMTGRARGFGEGILGKVKGMRAELAAPSDGPLERLLVDRIIVCWVHLQYAEITYAQALGSLDVEWTEAYQKRIDRAHRRYLSAIRSLAQVRRLRVPTSVQINVGEQQTNVAGAGIRPVA
jgi:hypothetical protein